MTKLGLITKRGLLDNESNKPYDNNNHSTVYVVTVG